MSGSDALAEDISGPDALTPELDEFAQIARRFVPLTFGAPEALGLLDDAAVIAARPGYDLVITQDTLVEGVHFLAHERGDRVAQKLLRVNLSDLAAKGADPYGCFLAISWPGHYDSAARDLFAKALGDDLGRFGLAVFGGDTTATPGPLTASLTVLGWVKAGAMVQRKGAVAGDLIFVSGTIGDGYLGLRAAQGQGLGLAEPELAALTDRYHCPQPRLALKSALLTYAHAAADISDGLIADCGHIAKASGLGVRFDLDLVPLSAAASRWATEAGDRAGAMLALATGGDDYEIVCAVDPARADDFSAAAQLAGIAVTRVGQFTSDVGSAVYWQGRQQTVGHGGYRHS